MEVHVAFLPQEAGDVRCRVAVVIDVLRATTSMLTLLERGCAEVVVAPSVEAARRYAAESARRRVVSAIEAGRRGGDDPPAISARPVRTAGEEGGLAPAGFEFGNSPSAFARADVTGSRFVIATTNGTRALHAVRGAPAVFTACLRNRAAAARAAADAALRGGFDLTVVCAGREGRFSLDDAYAAGGVVEAVAEHLAGRAAYTSTDAVLAARTLYHAWSDPIDVFRQTAGGRNILAIGLEEDLCYCAVRDCSELVPRVGEGLTLLE
ncbi:MAG TPA: 2-phosphosulfolactate phosphatase [bacterium]|nr:2-phosphosulfolactate phosphatase [bacterium]